MPESSNSRPRRRNQTPIDTNYGHLQPQALDIEKVVLGALMIDKDAFTVVSEIIRPETFYEPRNQKIFKAVQTLNLAEKPVDIMTVTEELKKEIQNYVKQHTAPYKYPRVVVFRDELPKTISGKIIRNKL